jgi:hypothetical protein
MPAVGQLKKQAIVTLGASYSGPVARHCCWRGSVRQLLDRQMRRNGKGELG